jgi:hypothetical protein
VTVAAVRHADTQLAGTTELILRTDHQADGIDTRVYPAAELHTLGGDEAVQRAEHQADTPPRTQPAHPRRGATRPARHRTLDTLLGLAKHTAPDPRRLEDAAA